MDGIYLKRRITYNQISMWNKFCNKIKQVPFITSSLVLSSLYHAVYDDVELIMMDWESNWMIILDEWRDGYRYLKKKGYRCNNIYRVKIGFYQF